MIRPSRGVADRPPYHRAPMPRDDSSPARGIMIAAVLSAPLWWPAWCGLAALAGWARVVMGGK